MPRNTAVFAPTFNGQGVVRLDDVTKDPRYGQNAPHHGMPEGHLPVRSYLAVPVVSRSGEVLGGLFFGHEQPGVFTDKAERLVIGIASQAAIALDNARLYQQAQEAVAKREEFLSVAAHELKTPITSLRMATQVLLRQLQRRPASELERLPQMLSVMELQSEKLSQLVTQLLDISRLDAGQLALERSEVDLVEMVRSVVKQTQSLVTDRSFNIGGIETARLSLDALRVEQVLVNLVNNAVKYSPDGGPVEIEITQPGPDAVQVAVRDHGIGVAPEQQERIFERFYRVAESEYTTGLGLGLYISRQIAEHHGGHLSVECPPDGGSRFLLTLPIGA
jgi:signal transduction histidine kinase